MMIASGIFFTASCKRGNIQNFQGKIFALDKNDSKYDARKEYFKNKMDEELDAKKSKRKEKFNDIETKIEEC